MLSRRIVYRSALIALLCAVAGGGAGLLLPPQSKAQQELKAMPAIQFGQGEIAITDARGTVHRFQAEVAVTPQQQARGLMFRTELADDRAMIFPEDPPAPTGFWMRNTLIPLDMIFVAPDRTVLRIEHEATPLSERNILSGGPVSAVIEVRGGLTQQLGIAAGDRVGWTVTAPAPQ